MRKEECEFSHFTIHPGHGRHYVPIAFLSTKPVLIFSHKKCFRLYLRKKNPREVPWTRTYRRLHKKTATDRVVRRRTYKVQRAQRAYVGCELSYIQEIRAKHPKVDRTAKGAAIRAEVAERKAAKEGKVAAAPAPKPAKK